MQFLLDVVRDSRPRGGGPEAHDALPAPENLHRAGGDTVGEPPVSRGEEITATASTVQPIPGSYQEIPAPQIPGDSLAEVDNFETGRSAERESLGAEELESPVSLDSETNKVPADEVDQGEVSSTPVATGQETGVGGGAENYPEPDRDTVPVRHTPEDRGETPPFEPMSPGAVKTAGRARPPDIVPQPEGEHTPGSSQRLQDESLPDSPFSEDAFLRPPRSPNLPPLGAPDVLRERSLAGPAPDVKPARERNPRRVAEGPTKSESTALPSVARQRVTDPDSSPAPGGTGPPPPPAVQTLTRFPRLAHDPVAKGIFPASAEAAARDRVEEGPQVHIGKVDIVVQAEEPRRRSSRPRGVAENWASRLYLRNL